MTRSLLLAALALAAVPLAAQEASDPPLAAMPALPRAPEPDRTPRAAAAVRERPAGADSADAGSLRGVRAAFIKEGEARLRLSDGERTVRPGDVLAGDVVKSIEPGRIVLVRGASAQDPAGTATIVVRFDAAGRGSVRVYHTKPAPVAGVR